jgi:branched-chain amino acid transport system ATP-binding protein
MESGSALEIEGVTVVFGGLRALSDLTVTFQRGAITGLIGPNGSGKSTLVNKIVGDVGSRSGAIWYDGRDIAARRSHQIVSCGIARTYQIPRFPPELTIREIIDVPLHYVDRARHVPDGMRSAQAIAAFCALAQPIDTQCAHLSVPDLRRLEIARALACGPACLFLDEVMAGLSHEDQLQMIALVRNINEMGVTVIVIEHVMRIISNLCHSTVVLNSGRLLATGAPADVLALPSVREAYLGRSFKI